LLVHPERGKAEAYLIIDPNKEGQRQTSAKGEESEAIYMSMLLEWDSRRETNNREKI